MAKNERIKRKLKMIERIANDLPPRLVMKLLLAVLAA